MNSVNPTPRLRENQSADKEEFSLKWKTLSCPLFSEEALPLDITLLLPGGLSSWGFITPEPDKKLEKYTQFLTM